MQNPPREFFKEDSLFQAKLLMALRIAASTFRGRHWALTTTTLRLLPVGNKTNRTANN